MNLQAGRAFASRPLYVPGSDELAVAFVNTRSARTGVLCLFSPDSPFN